MANTVELYDQGLTVLLEKLGVVKTEQFIAIVKRENFDYTKWQREYFDRMPEGAFTKASEEYEKLHPYTGRGQII
jgi:hypothetical protein